MSRVVIQLYEGGFPTYSYEEVSRNIDFSLGNVFEFTGKKYIITDILDDGDIKKVCAQLDTSEMPNMKLIIDSENAKSVKNDFKDKKLRWDLLPLKEIEEIVRVYTAGAEKYGANRWQNLPDGYNRYKAAFFRHLVEFEKGNEIDEETGCLHLAQCCWNALAMLHFSMKDK